MKIILIFALFLVAVDAVPAQKIRGPGAPAESTPFLDRTIGHWKGTGTSYGSKISDEMWVDKTLGDKWVHIHFVSTGLDKYVGEVYLRCDGPDGRYEFYEFNNGAWPLRLAYGKVVGNTLSVEEHAEGRDIRITFELPDKTTFKLTEATIAGKSVKPFVEEVFVKLAK